MPAKKILFLSLLVLSLLFSGFARAGEISDAMKGKDLDPRFIQALDQYLAGQFKEAIANFNEVLKSTPENAFTHNFLGHALKEDGQLDEAIKEYKEAIRLNPRYAYAHNNLGEALMDKGDIDGAIEQFELAIGFDPRHVLADRNLKEAKKKKAGK